MNIQNFDTVQLLTDDQITDMVNEISKRWVFTNYGSYFNCRDNKTRQNSNDGGDRNFAYHNFQCKVQQLYLEYIGRNFSYFDWQINEVPTSEARKSYMFELQDKIVEALCGFKNKPSTIQLLI